MKIMNGIKVSIFLAAFFVLCFSCRRDQEQIPNVAVSIFISTSDPNFIDLNAVGGWVYVTGGVKGIIIYRKSQNEFMAFDRCCSYKPSVSCERVRVDTVSNLFCIDDCCGSRFLITDGSVQAAPASLPLKRYNTSFDGMNISVYN